MLSPRDETFAKFGFYAVHGVEEVWVADPLERSVRIWQLRAPGQQGQQGPGYDETGRSGLLDVTADSVAADLEWLAE